MADPDPIKDLLKSIRDAVCGVASDVAGMAGPVTDPVLKQRIERRLCGAARQASGQLFIAGKPLFVSSDDWIFWLPTSAHGQDLSQLSSTACAEAQQALDRYCANDPLPPTPADVFDAAKALWHTVSLFPHVLEKAGIQRAAVTSG